MAQLDINRFKKDKDINPYFFTTDFIVVVLECLFFSSDSSYIRFMGRGNIAHKHQKALRNTFT